MSLRALVYAYVLGGFTFLPLLIFSFFAYALYTSVPVGDPDVSAPAKAALEKRIDDDRSVLPDPPPLDLHDLPKTRRGWLTVRRTFQEQSIDGSYVTLMKSFLDARSKDPKRSRPRDMWYVVLKGKVLYLYEDEGMTECEAAIELSGHDVVVYPEGLLDGELYSKRNAICLKPKGGPGLPSLTREMQHVDEHVEEKAEEKSGGNGKKKQKEKEKLAELERRKELAREQALDSSTPWYIFVRSNVEMEDWYFALVHASDNLANSSTLSPLTSIFNPTDMDLLISNLDQQPDVIPMRWLNALLGRIFFSFYSTDFLESYIIGRFMKKLSKVKRPNFLTELLVSEVDMGKTPVTFGKPMLKELTKEGDASVEMLVQYKGELRITIQATAAISLGFKTHTVKLVLAVVLRELEGNMVIKIKRPPSNRLWYAFTTMPKMVLHVEPVVSDRQITWNMILHSIESRLKEVILESIVLPNMDDIAFFDSSKYQHRGGIWPDAGRREKPVSTGTGHHKHSHSDHTHTPVADDDASTVSAPPPNVDATLATPATDHLTAAHPLKRSRSVGELRVDDRSPSPTLKHAATEANPADHLPTVSTPSSAKSQHHWFTHEDSHHVADDPETISLSDADSKHDKKKHRLPQLKHSSTTLTTDSSHSGGSKKKRFLGVRKSSRPSSPSQGTLSRTPSPVPSLENLHASSSSRLDSGSTKSVASSSQSSLLSTLKRNDTQASNHTAKEVIKKWTATWAGKKKHHNGTDHGEDMPDGEDHRNKHHLGKHKDNEQKEKAGKTTYAEMRAAVEERREKENGHLRRKSESTSSPVSVPEVYRKSRAGSLSSQSVTGSLASVEASSSSNSSYTMGSEGSHTPSPDTAATLSYRVPPPPVQLAVRQPSPSPRPGSANGRPSSSSGLEPDGPTTIISPPTPVTAPIRQQPAQARTMTIPGIHASHKGEVQAMGYVPPAPQPAPPTESVLSSVQGVYRLWKQNASAESQVLDAQASDAASSSSSTTVGGEAQPVSPRLVPPPLPPRVPSS
ncbi:hypothetical protein FA95DRAFT_1597905, partial [Auriscalpium vulgare]